MKRVVLVYDDTVEPSSRVKTILGRKSFGEMILKRQTMFSRMKEQVKASGAKVEVKKLSSLKNLDGIAKLPENTNFFHILSSAAPVSSEDFSVLLNKLEYIENNTAVVGGGRTSGVIIPGRKNYFDFLEEYSSQGSMGFLQGDTLETNMFMNLENYDLLLMYISGGFDARYFNSLQGDTHTVTKRSRDKNKMKAEYTYYWLLPDKMKSFMVMPYDFKDEGETASYTMERMPMTDVAIRWTHGAIDTTEFRKILGRTFYFFESRETKEIDKSEYIKNAEKLYLEKVDERIQTLKKLPEYVTLEKLISSGTGFRSVDEIVAIYKSLYEKIEKKHLASKKFFSVIGHGDVFFANMLYSKETDLLRLIDPKGALEERQLWMNPYYDIAKLSHSICGNYDFFNTGSYDIVLDKNMRFKLVVHADNSEFVEIFKEYLGRYGYDYNEVRLFEASLFLSMLPLHIDNPHKVFGFILNAINILKEIEENV